MLRDWRDVCLIMLLVVVCLVGGECQTVHSWVCGACGYSVKVTCKAVFPVPLASQPRSKGAVMFMKLFNMLVNSSHHYSCQQSTVAFSRQSRRERGREWGMGWLGMVHTFHHPCCTFINLSFAVSFPISICSSPFCCFFHSFQPVLLLFLLHPLFSLAHCNFCQMPRQRSITAQMLLE